MIGESFGVYVNFKIANALGGVKHVLAFNPANELGGYKPPDLKLHARLAWSFHTYSPYDTRAELGHSEVFLETPTDSDYSAQHTFGVVWLARQVEQADHSWLLLKQKLPERKVGAFCCKTTLTGLVEDISVSRVPKSNSSEISAPALSELAARE